MPNKDRRSKPKVLEHDEREVLSVYENIWLDPNEPVGSDLRAKRGVKILGNLMLFKKYSNDEQAALAMKISMWFFRYARWIKSRPEGRV